MKGKADVPFPALLNLRSSQHGEAEHLANSQSSETASNGSSYEPICLDKPTEGDPPSDIRSFGALSNPTGILASPTVVFQFSSLFA